MKSIFNLLLFIAISTISFGQSSSDLLTGFWKGAFIKGNGIQLIDVEISNRDSSLMALQIMEEWHPYYGEFEVEVVVDSNEVISFPTGYGEVEVLLDKNNLEMHGKLKGGSPTAYLHLKKTSPRAELERNVEEITFQSGDVTLNGYLHSPKYESAKTAIVLVDGRGCYQGDKEFNIYGKALAKYGVAVLAYDKRGLGKSQGDCGTATIDQLAEDAAAAYDFLKNHPSNFEQIGVIGGSAGGWTMAKTEEQVDFDFMIGVVGPSTSVYDQQIQSLEAGAEIYELSAEAVEHGLEYTNILFQEKITKKDYQKMNELLALAESEGWSDLLDDTDVAATYEDVANLWVRRHSYDPKEVWLNYDKPALMIYGEKDWIVPHENNVETIEKYFAGKEELLKTVVAYDAEHGMSVNSKWEDIGGGNSYRRFYRISPHLQIEIVDFLIGNGFAK